MTCLYQTPVDLCRATGTVWNFLRGSRSLKDILDANLNETCKLSGAIFMTIGLAALILGSAGCYASYSGRLGRLGTPCAVVGLPLAVLGWDVIQIGRFHYHLPVDESDVANDPIFYAMFFNGERSEDLGISGSDRINGMAYLNRNNRSDEARKHRAYFIAKITANTIAARFHHIFNFLTTVADHIL